MAVNELNPETWGVRPVLFHLGSLDVPSYGFFIGLGILAGVAVYFYEAKKQGGFSEKGLYLAMGSLVGGVLGAKILKWMIDYKYFFANLDNWPALLSGRTIVGGLIGGTIGVWITKKILGLKEKRGNLFAPAVALGVAIGRLGCFFRGCCYGTPTNLPWGVDFGDGIARHPTQLYESLFMLAMFIYLEKVKDRPDVKPGQLFKTLMIAYFIYRFLVEFIKVENTVWLGLTIFQLISIGVILYLVRENVINLITKRQKYAHS
jgi:phosphatidylglycerol:prolipoprotein diacylglycerol transferase